MRVLITGGSGFVGNYIFNFLKDLYDVLRPSSQELNLLDSNQVNSYFEKNKIDCVIHCALTGREDLSSSNPIYLSDGLLMFRNLWNNKSLYSTFINLGTAYEFDLRKNNQLITEKEIVNHIPITSYGYSKNIIARIIQSSDNFYNLRLFGVFHETESSKRFLQKVKNQDEIIISNDQYLDYIYLPDILPMIKCIIEGNSQHRDINMVYPIKYKLSEIALFLCEYLELPKTKVKVTGTSNNNLTGDSSILANYHFDFIGLHQGLRNYK